MYILSNQIPMFGIYTCFPSVLPFMRFHHPAHLSSFRVSTALQSGKIKTTHIYTHTHLTFSCMIVAEIWMLMLHLGERVRLEEKLFALAQTQNPTNPNRTDI